MKRNPIISNFPAGMSFKEKGNERHIKKQDLFPTFTAGTSVKEKVEIIATRHMNNYFRDIEDLESIAEDLRPLQVVTQEALESAFSKTEILLNKKLAWLISSNKKFAINYRNNLNTFKSVQEAKAVASELWRKYGDYDRSRATKLPGGSSKRSRIDGESEVQYRKRMKLKYSQEGNLSYLESSDIQHVDNNEDEESDIQEIEQYDDEDSFYWPVQEDTPFSSPEAPSQIQNSTKKTKKNDLFPPFPSGMSVREKVEITAKRHLNNYFIDEQDLKSIAKELRPNLIVTQEALDSALSKTEKTVNKKLAWVYSSNQPFAIKFMQNLQTCKSLQEAKFIACDLWRKHGDYDRSRATKLPGGTNRRIRIEGETEGNYRKRLMFKNSKEKFSVSNEEILALRSGVMQILDIGDPFQSARKIKEEMQGLDPNYESPKSIKEAQTDLILNLIQSKLQTKVNTTDIKPFCCDLCNKSFFTQYALTKHQQFLHALNNSCNNSNGTETKPYSCDVCDESFFTQYALTKHMKLHTNDDKRSSESYRLSVIKDRQDLSHTLDVKMEVEGDHVYDDLEYNDPLSVLNVSHSKYNYKVPGKMQSQSSIKEEGDFDSEDDSEEDQIEDDIDSVDLVE